MVINLCLRFSLAKIGVEDLLQFIPARGWSSLVAFTQCVTYFYVAVAWAFLRMYFESDVDDPQYEKKVKGFSFPKVIHINTVDIRC